MKCIAWLLPVFLVMTANLFAQDGKTTPLSDGKSFEGWEGNLKAFRIEEGAFVAGTLKGPNPRNEYLCTTKEYDNFELRLKCKAVRVDPSRVTGPLPAYSPNGGIQIRSERVPNSGEMIGYQADAGPTAWGDLYDERRHWMLVKVKPEELEKIVKKGQWNDYIIRCQGFESRFGSTATRRWITPSPIRQSPRPASSACRSTSAPRANCGTKTSHSSHCLRRNNASHRWCAGKPQTVKLTSGKNHDTTQMDST